MGVDAEAQVILLPQAVVHTRRERIVANVFTNGVDCGAFKFHRSRQRRLGVGQGGARQLPVPLLGKADGEGSQTLERQVRINTCDGLTGERQLVSPTFKLSFRKSYRRSLRF
jgi:hypothetical protein